MIDYYSSHDLQRHLDWDEPLWDDRLLVNEVSFLKLPSHKILQRQSNNHQSIETRDLSLCHAPRNLSTTHDLPAAPNPGRSRLHTPTRSTKYMS